MDPNWFYSTLAQSTAAIVGLMGGFLAQQLLAQRTEVAKLREAVRNRASQEFTGHIQPIRRAATEVLESLTTIRELLVEAVAAGTVLHGVPNPTKCAVLTPPPQTPSTATLGMNEGLSAADLSALERGIEVASDLRVSLPRNFETYVEELRTQHGLREPRADYLAERPWAVNAKPQPGPDFRTWLTLQGDVAAELWDALARDTAPIAEHLTNFRARLVPGRFFWLLGILALLMAGGVIAPMFFLSARDDGSQASLLAAFIPLAFALLAFFALELRRLRRADRLAPDTF